MGHGAPSKLVPWCSPFSLPFSFFFFFAVVRHEAPAEGNKSAAGPNGESTCRTASLFTLLQALVTVSVASASPLFSLSLPYPRVPFANSSIDFAVVDAAGNEFDNCAS